MQPRKPSSHFARVLAVAAALVSLPLGACVSPSGAPAQDSTRTTTSAERTPDTEDGPATVAASTPTDDLASAPSPADDCDDPAFDDVSGVFHVRYSCSEVAATGAAEAQPICIEKDGSVDTTVTKRTDGRYDVSIGKSGKFVGTGRLCGLAFRWSAHHAGTHPFTETGVWTFENAHTYTQSSRVVFEDPGTRAQDCSGSASSNGPAKPPAPVGACR
jgi:hypothetical protein